MAQPTTIEAGHTVLTLPAGMQVYAAPLARGFTGGDPVRIERKVVLLSPGTRPPAAALLVESTREAGRYIWTESCKQLHNDAHTFVHSPFHAMSNACAFAGGQPLPTGAGWVVKSTYASASGSMLSTMVFVREPLARLSTAPESMPDDTGVPAAVVAWTRALNDQVRGAMRSFSGAWQLPPLEGKTED